MPKLTKINSGFTLVESLIYISIAGVIFTVIGAFWGASLTARAKSAVILEVELQGQQILNQFAESAHTATAINYPLPGVNSPSLSLVEPGALNPAVVSLDSGTIVVSEGSGTPVPLHSSKITASNLSFTNLAATGTPGNVQISFTLTYNNSSGRSEFEYSKTFVTSASLYKL